MRRLIFLIIAALSAVFSSCGGKPFPEEIFDRKNVFKVWALADIQPARTAHRRAFEKAVADINLNTKGIQMAFVAGDIVNFPEGGVFDWYLSERSKSYIRNWREIAGNHDMKDGGALYREKIGEFHQTYVYGNIVFVFLSDEEGNKATTIEGDTFEWWKKTLENNRGKIIVVITHAPLEGSSIMFSGLKDRQILRSERFSEVLKKEKVDLWLSGHLHLPHFFPRTITRKKNLGGTTFVHISSIRPELAGLKNSESRLLAFYCGTKKASIFSRNHEKEKWQNLRAKHIELSKTVVCPE